VLTTHSSCTKQPSKLPKSTQVRSHGNNVRDVIIAHVISADAQRYRCRKHKVILGPAGRTQSVQPAGKNWYCISYECEGLGTRFSLSVLTYNAISVLTNTGRERVHESGSQYRAPVVEGPAA